MWLNVTCLEMCVEDAGLLITPVRPKVKLFLFLWGDDFYFQLSLFLRFRWIHELHACRDGIHNLLDCEWAARWHRSPGCVNNNFDIHGILSGGADNRDPIKRGKVDILWFFPRTICRGNKGSANSGESPFGIRPPCHKRHIGDADHWIRVGTNEVERLLHRGQSEERRRYGSHHRGKEC